MTASASWFEIVDPVFSQYVLFNAPLKKLAEGFDWAEGPVWFGDHQCLLFSDIPDDRIMRWSEAGLTTFRAPAGSSTLRRTWYCSEVSMLSALCRAPREA